MGYDDAARYFARPSRYAEHIAAQGASPSAPPRFPTPAELPPAPRHVDLALLAIILLGWAQRRQRARERRRVALALEEQLRAIYGRPYSDGEPDEAERAMLLAN